jgi:FkbM family methyltransferase
VSEFNRLQQSRHGLVLYNANDTYVGRSFELYGEFSEGEVQLFQQILRPGDVVVDAGANIGAHTLVFAKAVGPSGAIFAFEPQRLLFQTLCANMALNSLTNVSCFQAALGSQPGSLRVPPLDYGQQANFGGLSLGEFQIGEAVPIQTVDSLQLPQCRLLKIDVEGMEQEVLAGSTQTIRHHQPVLYVENDRQEKAEALIRFIDTLGYKMFWHKPRLFNPDNFLQNPENVFGNVGSINMLCVPRNVPTNFKGAEAVHVPGGEM